MKSNFSFLKENKEYELFADACIDAENVASSAPALSVSGSRKALELAIKWLYAADEFLQLPSADILFRIYCMILHFRMKWTLRFVLICNIL